MFYKFTGHVPDLIPSTVSDNNRLLSGVAKIRSEQGKVWCVDTHLMCLYLVLPDTVLDGKTSWSSDQAVLKVEADSPENAARKAMYMVNLNAAYRFDNEGEQPGQLEVKWPVEAIQNEANWQEE
jgi:hypothetical protein